jgi:hypothetical protein
MGAWTWPNKPGPPETPLMGCLMGCLGLSPNYIQLDSAANVLLVSSYISFETKFINVKLKLGL